MDSVDIHVDEQRYIPKRNDDDDFPIYEDQIERDEKGKDKFEPQVQQPQMKK